MRGILLTTLFGLIGLVLGIMFFGQINGERISFDSQTLQKLTTFEGIVEVARSQPIAVWICLSVGIVLGLMSAVFLWKHRKKRGEKAKTKPNAADQTTPEEPQTLPRTTQEIDDLDSMRPLLCRFLTGLTLCIWKFYAVPQGSALVVVGLGKYRKCCPPGLGCIFSLWGLYHRPYKKIPLVSWKERVDPYEQVDVFTSDGVRCIIDFMMCYRIVDPGKALFEVDDYEKGIKTTVISAVRNECGKQQARTLLASREKMAVNLKEFLDREISPWGINIRLVEITKIDIAVQDKRGSFKEV